MIRLEKKSLVKSVTNCLNKAIREQKADFGNVQLYNAGSDSLFIFAQEGFGDAFLEYFRTVKPYDNTACGRSTVIGKSLIIGDVNLDISFVPHVEIAKNAGFRSVISTPFYNDLNELLGVISLHGKKPKWNWSVEKIENRLVDLRKLVSNES